MGIETSKKLTPEQIVAEFKRLYVLIPSTIEKSNYELKMPKYYEEALKKYKYPLFK